MVKRNCSLPFSFYCISDRKQSCETIFIDKDLDLETYWWKICLFNLNWDNPTLYFDLDIFIQNDIKHIINKIEKNRLLTVLTSDCGVRYRFDGSGDNIRVIPSAKINSSIMGFYPKDLKHLYNLFFKNADYNIVKYYGLDRFITHNYDNNKFKFLDYGKDWYHRSQELRLDSTICILNGRQERHYKELEKYFL